MKYLLFVALTLSLLAACSPTSTPTPPPLDMPVDDGSVPDGRPFVYEPQPGDDQLQRGPTFIDSVELLTMESFPVQFSLLVKGNLPTPCHELRIVTHKPDGKNQINIEIYAVTSPKKMCVEMIAPFEQTIALGSFPAGHYTVWINEKQWLEFDAQ